MRSMVTRARSLTAIVSKGPRFMVRSGLSGQTEVLQMAANFNNSNQINWRVFHSLESH